LTVPNNAAFQFGSGEFTIDGWFYSTSSGDQAVMSRWSSPDSNSAWEIIRVSGTTYFQVASSSSAISVTTSDFPLNQWNHFAMSKSSTTMAAWLNGTRIGTNTVSGSVNNGDQGLSIGVRAGGTSYPFVGYLANLRVVKGTDVYGVSNTTITVPTAPTTAITNTSFLGNMTNAGIPDLAMQNNLETVGNAQVVTSVKKYGTGSLSFDGTGDRLFASTNPVYSLRDSDYTIEMWVYPNSFSGSPYLVSTGNGGTNWAMYLDTSGNLAWGGNTGVNQFNSSTPISTGVWSHLAISQSGSNVYWFVGGVLSLTKTKTDINNANWATTQQISVGSNFGTNDFNGYIDDLRITKGLARYTATFTPPTIALPTY
jgi:hypothetical protein